MDGVASSPMIATLLPRGAACALLLPPRRHVYSGALLRSERAPPRRVQLAPGTRLARVWRGIRHEVEVVDGGYLFDLSPDRRSTYVKRDRTSA